MRRVGRDRYVGDQGAGTLIVIGRVGLDERGSSDAGVSGARLTRRVLSEVVGETCDWSAGIAGTDVGLHEEDDAVAACEVAAVQRGCGVGEPEPGQRSTSGVVI